MNNFTIRLATEKDLPEILKIYENARAFMKANGNESQWGLPSPGKTCWPSEESVVSRITDGYQYICECTDEETTNGQNPIIAATFAFTNGVPEPVYSTIFDGSWPDDPDNENEPYGVIHCFASAGTVKGAASFSINWALQQCGYMKIDTHPNNKPMRSLLEKLGFQYCGKVDFQDSVQNDDSIRVAYWKKI